MVKRYKIVLFFGKGIKIKIKSTNMKYENN